MKITYIKSATVVIEHGGKKVLCDPWLTDGIYYGAWYHWPILKFSAKDFQDVDYIFISHVHPDHCDVESLKDIPKNIPVIIHDFKEKFLLGTIKRLGFTDIREVGNRQTIQLGPDFFMESIAGDDCNGHTFARAYNCAPIKHYTQTLNIDSLAIFSGGGKVVVNSNDVPVALIHSALSYIKSKYQEIDMLLVSYAGAGPYPQAYDMPIERMMHDAVGVAYSFLSGTLLYLKALVPRYFMPYAGQYTLGGKNAWRNSYKGTLELDELVLDLLPAVTSARMPCEMVLLDSGESFDVDTAQASGPFTPTDFLARDAYIKGPLAKKKFVFEDLPAPGDLYDKMVEARAGLWDKQMEYDYFSDSQVFIDTGLEYFYQINFNSKEIKKVSEIKTSQPFVRAALDSRLMSMILDRQANWNNAEIGSHILLFDYLGSEHKENQRNYEPMPHHLMAYFQRPRFALKVDEGTVAKVR